MLYDVRKFLCGTALSLVIGLGTSTNVYAQATLSLMDDELPAIDSTIEAPATEPINASIPDEISLFDDETSTGFDETTGMISPPAAKTAPIANASAEEEVDIVIPSTSPATSSYNAPSAPIATNNSRLGDNILDKINSDLFERMSDIEKQTTLLNLELRREKVKTEIEAIKAQRKRAEDEEIEQAEEKRRKQIEWEKEQEVKILEAQKQLRETEVALEKLRQEKVLKAYKGTMLENHQKWIAANQTFYRDYADVEKDRDALISDFKIKLKKITATAEETKAEADTARQNYNREIQTLQTQVTVLKARLEAAESEKGSGGNANNPFATSLGGMEDNENIRLSDEYAIMEIRGQSGQLNAKLVNRDERSFIVKEGTVLQSGHIVDQITQTYVRADKGGKKDYIYFSAGGAVEKEPGINEVEEIVRANAYDRANAEANGGAVPFSGGGRRRGGLTAGDGVPSLNTGMMIK